MWSFAWQNLITRPTRTALAVLGLTIPILAFIGLFSLSGGIRHLMGDTLASLQNLMILRENAPIPVLSDLPPTTGAALRRIPGVKVAAGEVWKVAPTIDGRNRGGGLSVALDMLTKSREDTFKSFLNMVAVEGQEIREHARLTKANISKAILPASNGGGRFLNEQDSRQPNVVISTMIAREYPNADGTPKKVGETIRLGSREFNIVGLFDTGSLLIDATIVMDIDSARDLLHLGPDSFSTFNVEPEDGVNADELIDRIEKALPDVRAQRISQFSLTVGSVMEQLNKFLLLAVGLALLVGGVGIANTMLMSTSERYVEFGVMRTNGWTRRNVMALVTAESALLGLLSGVLGGGLATVGVLTVNRFLDGLSLDLSPWLIVASLVGALVIASLSGLYPAWKASRMTPMDAIRHSAA